MSTDPVRMCAHYLRPFSPSLGALSSPRDHELKRERKKAARQGENEKEIVYESIMAHPYGFPGVLLPIRCPFSARICNTHRVPCTKYTSTMVAISQHDKFFQPAPTSISLFSSFSPQPLSYVYRLPTNSHPRCSSFSFCPRIGRMLLGDDATEEESFIRSNSGSPGWKYRTNRVDSVSLSFPFILSVFRSSIDVWLCCASSSTTTRLEYDAIINSVSEPNERGILSPVAPRTVILVPDVQRIFGRHFQGTYIGSRLIRVRIVRSFFSS